MEIIKKGSVTKQYKMTCAYCGCEALYDSADIHYDRDGAYIICPCCKHFITHKLPLKAEG